MAQVDILLYYDTDLRKFTTEAGSITAVTKIQLGQLNTVDVVLAVIKDGVAIELTTPSWILGIKEINDQSGDYLIQATSATKTGTGTTTRYTFTFTFDSTELRAFFETYDPTQDYLALEIRDTVNGIVTLPALIVDPVPAYTVEGTTPTDASGTLIVASGKTVNISNSITLTGTDSETYNLDTLADIPAVRYTASQGLTSQQQIDARANISVPSVTEMQTVDNLKANLAGGNTFTGTQVFSDALTFDGTTWTYGAGAAAAHKTALSLGNVDNTSDTNKPVSTETQTALNLKANLADGNSFSGAQVITGNGLLMTVGDDPAVLAVGTPATTGAFVGGYYAAAGNTSTIYFASNGYYSGSAFVQPNTAKASCFYVLQGGAHLWYAQSAGNANNSIGNVIGRITSAGMAVGSSAPAASAKLDVVSTTQGFLPPRMTTTQRNAISSPATGLMVYNTTTNKINFYNGSAWEAVTSA